MLVVNVMGRVFMDALDDPFAAVDRELAACPLGEQADAIVVDFHAEATSEKQALGHHLDGRATLVVGTHTHVPTSDHRILAGGTAYQSDAGMCGDYDSRCSAWTRRSRSTASSTRCRGERFSPADGPGDALRRSPSRSTTTPGLPRRSAPLRLGGVLIERCRPSGS